MQASVVSKVSMAEELAQRVAAKNYDVQVNVPPRIPFPHPIDMEKAERWIQMHPSACHETMRAVVENTNHVPFQKFYEVFQRVIGHLNEELKGEPYVIMSRQQKSNTWMIDLALPRMSHLPEGIYDLDSDKLILAQKLKSKEFKHIVFFDDASYSGKQMSEDLQRITRMAAKVNIHVGVPYITSWALQKISKVELKEESVLDIAPHVVMQGMQEQIPAHLHIPFYLLFYPVELENRLKGLIKLSSLDWVKDWLKGKNVGEKPIKFLESIATSASGNLDELKKVLIELVQIADEESFTKRRRKYAELLISNPKSDNYETILRESLVEANKFGLDVASIVANPFRDMMASRTLTYFDHKFPDAFSTFEELLDPGIYRPGLGKSDELDTSDKFINLKRGEEIYKAKPGEQRGTVDYDLCFGDRIPE